MKKISENYSKPAIVMLLLTMIVAGINGYMFVANWDNLGKVETVMLPLVIITLLYETIRLQRAGAEV